MATAHLDGLELNYEILGRTGPWVAVISSGRQSLTDPEGLADAIAARGHRVIVHDRRNCGRSSLDFDSLVPEEELWADDLQSLLDSLGVPRVFVVGLLRGARIAIRFAQRHPDSVRGQLLWGLSGGQLAVRFLDEYYFGKYLRACRAGGMAAVCELDHFAGLVAARPSNGAELLAMDPGHFTSVMRRRRNEFLAGADHIVMGLTDDELRMISTPTALVPYYDRMHPDSAIRHAGELIFGSRLLDYEPGRRATPTISAAERLHDVAVVASLACDFAARLPEGPGRGRIAASRWLRRWRAAAR